MTSRTTLTLIAAVHVLAGLGAVNTIARTNPNMPVAKMRSLAKRIANGDDDAFQKLEEMAQKLYRDVNPTKDKERVASNAAMLNAAFEVLGEEAGQGNAHAFQALRDSLGAEHLKSFAPRGFGIAAAGGDEKSMDILLNHDRYDIPNASAVAALEAAARKNDPRAVDFLLNVLDDPKARPLWHMAAEGLRGAASKGNPKAKEALKQYEKAQ